MTNKTEKEPKIKLTKAQDKILKSMTDGRYLRPHQKPTGLFVYRLMDAETNPIANYRSSVVNRLYNKNYLKKDGVNFIKA